MSHFSVAVITKTNNEYEVEQLLEKFNENLEMDPYLEKTRDEAIEEGREIAERRYKNAQERIEKAKEEGEDLRKEDLKDIEEYKNWEDFSEEKLYEEYIDCNYFDSIKYLQEEGTIDDEGNVYSTYNPNSKWDWYQIGGRFSGLLKIKNQDLYCDSAKISDVDFYYKDPEKAKIQERYWDLVVNKKEPTEEDKRDFWLAFTPEKEYFLERYGSKENYVDQMTQTRTYAILLPDSNWYEAGEMGWFGISHASTNDEKTFDESYFNILDLEKYKDYYITIVDCHI